MSRYFSLLSYAIMAQGVALLIRYKSYDQAVACCLTMIICAIATDWREGK
jgi:hypothetical protein